MTFANLNRGPGLSEDERKLAQLDELIRNCEARERAKAEREAEEARVRAEAETARGALPLDELRARRDAIQARLIERETHLRAEAERERLQRRAEALAAEIELGETRLADLRAQREALLLRTSWAAHNPRG